jgi:PAS domain S-box-containing protein
MWSLLDALDFGAMLIGADGRVLNCNRWLHERARWACEPVGRSLEACLGANLNPRLASGVAQALQRGHSSRLSTALHPHPLPLYEPRAGALGEPLRHAVDIIAHTPAHGARECLLQVRDMTESYRREEVLRAQAQRLRASERRLAATLDDAPIGMAVGRPGQPWSYVNRALCTLLGFPHAAMLSMDPQALREPDVGVAHAGLPQAVASREPLAQERPTFGREERWRHARGYWIWVHVTQTVLVDDVDADDRIIIQVASIEDRKRRERETVAALAEKEILLREVYHRVKNNLQVIQSLLNLQRSSVADASAKAALAETAERVRAMALVHEKLYASSHLSDVDLADYLKDLCAQVNEAFRTPGRRIELSVQAQPISADLNCAVPFGLIVSELLTNAYKHAFHGRSSGCLQIQLHADGNAALLEVRDDGVGLTDGPHAGRGGSLGLNLVRSLARQIDGEIALDQEAVGTTWRLRFRRLRGD